MKSSLRSFSLVFCLSLLPVLAQALPPISENANLNEYSSSAFQLPDNRICAVFENVPDFNAMKSQLYSVCLKDRRFTKARQLQGTAAQDFTYFANPRPVVIKGKIWIYFNAFNQVTQDARWGRFAFDEDNAETPIEWLTPPEDLQKQDRAWIYPTLTSENKILLTYEKFNFITSQREIALSLSDDGKTFPASMVITNQAQMARFAEFRKGPWAVSYQAGTGSAMMGYLMLSSDQGKTFSSRSKISEHDTIHDTLLFARQDGDLDVYYLVGFEGKGFSLFRRKVLRDGSLGPEQQLTSTAVAVEKPHCLRLSSGKIFVTLSKITPQGTAVTTDVVFMTLMDDAE